METLVFDGRTLFFEREWHDGEYSGYFTTKFYSELRTKKVKKYYFFGPLVEVPDNVFIFEIDADVKNIRLSKTELRKLIQAKIDLLNRADEIKNGEYV